MSAIILAALVLVASAYSFVTLSHAHETVVSECRRDIKFLKYDIGRNDRAAAKSLIQPASENTEIRVTDDSTGDVFAARENKITLDMYWENRNGFKGSYELLYDDFLVSFVEKKETNTQLSQNPFIKSKLISKALKSDKYKEICSYLRKAPSASKLRGKLRYELLCRAYYVDDDTKTVYPKSVVIVVTNGRSRSFSEDEVVKSYSLYVNTNGFEDKTLYRSGDAFRIPIDSEFVLGNNTGAQLIDKLGETHELNSDFEEREFPLVYTSFFYGEKKVAVSQTMKITYSIRYARRYDLLEICGQSLYLGLAAICGFFLVFGFFIAYLSWKAVRTEIEQELIRRDMTRAMAHDLKTPMFIISGYAENIREGISPEKHDHYLNVITEQTRRMNGLVHSMLDFSRTEDMDFELSMERFSLSELARELLGDYPDDKISLKSDGDCEIKADKNLITTVIDNFADNALKYSADGKAEVRIENGRFSVSNSVERDIPRNELEEVWKPYVKLDSSRESEGNGLGLAITKRILELHRFRFGADCADGRITFWFEA